MQTESAQAEPNASREVLHHFRKFAGLRLGELLEILKETLNEWSKDKAPRLGASLAFYTMLSLAPLLVVVVAVAAFAYGRQAAQGRLAWEIQGLVGPDGARTIEELIQKAYN